VFPGGNPHTVLGGINDLDDHANEAIAYVVNSLHPYGAGQSEQDYMFGLLGNAESTNRVYDGTLGINGIGPSHVYLGDDLPLASGTSDHDANAHMSPNGFAYLWDGSNDPNSYFPGIPNETLVVTRAAGDFTGANTSTTGQNPSVNNGQPYNQIVAGTAVLITAKSVDINTHIVVGPSPDWSVLMPSNLVVAGFLGLMVDLHAYHNQWLAGLWPAD